MEKIITGWEFWTLVAIIGALFLALEVLHRGKRMEELGDLRKCLTDAEKEAAAIEAEQDERDRRRMVHEADKEGSWGMCGYTPVFIPKKEEDLMVSMEPFCGEGKKP